MSRKTNRLLFQIKIDWGDIKTQRGKADIAIGIIRTFSENRFIFYFCTEVQWDCYYVAFFPILSGRIISGIILTNIFIG
jgi:hypothetical protein